MWSEREMKIQAKQKGLGWVTGCISKMAQERRNESGWGSDYFTTSSDSALFTAILEPTLELTLDLVSGVLLKATEEEL